MNGFGSRLQLELNVGNVTHYKYKNIIHKETQKTMYAKILLANFNWNLELMYDVHCTQNSNECFQAAFIVTMIIMMVMMLAVMVTLSIHLLCIQAVVDILCF